MTIQLKVLPKFPSNVLAASFLTLTKANGIWTVGVDYSKIAPIGLFDPSVEKFPVFNSLDGSYALISLASLINASQTTRVITAPGDVAVAVTDGLIILNKTVSQTTNVNLPASALKIGKVKIVDWKGDSASFPITVNCAGSDKLNGNLASWIISANGASAVFDPINTGIGYSV
jgi:hypothetical protein